MAMGVHWWWKTRKAHELAKADGGDVYIKSDSTKWFDGYDGHEIAILDDIREGWMPITICYLLDLILNALRLRVAGVSGNHG